MFTHLIFYNHGHLGDTFLCRPFIPEIKKIIPAKYYGFANNYPADYVLDCVDMHININNIPATPHMRTLIKDDICYFNTWCPFCFPKDFHETNRPFSNDGIAYNFDVFKMYFNAVLQDITTSQNLNYMDENKEMYVCDAYNVNVDFYNIPNFLYKAVRVLIFNQPSFSGQGEHIDYTPFIETVARNHPNIMFYTSVNTPSTLPNVIGLQSYFQFPDLYKFAIFSTQCDYICGPGNAPLEATWIKPNINNRNKHYIVMNQLDQGCGMMFQTQKAQFVVVKSVQEIFQRLDEQLLLH